MAKRNIKQEISAEGKANAETELEYLKTVRRPQVVQDIKTAREFGDLKENAEYHAAKDDQGHLEARIRSLEAQLVNLVVVDEDPDAAGRAILGSVVRFRDPAADTEATVTLVHSLEASLAEAKVSVESPMGEAFLGAKPGDKVTLTTPKSEKILEILEIT